MCYRPITIYNNSMYFNPEYSQLRKTVPCGSCCDCQRNISNAWYIRSRQEFQDCIKNGGMVIFPTLTFDNDHLPYLDYNFKNQSFHEPCFDMHLVNNFIKSFKVHLQRGIPRLDKSGHSTGQYDVLPIENVSGIRYLICSEYGSNTKRPHHHALIFLPFKMFPSHLMKILQRSWPNGFVGVSRHLGLEVKTYAGVRYTSKYVTKDLAFYDANNIKEYYRYIKQLSHLDNSYDEELKRIRQHLPYHRQSLFYGLNYLKSFEPSLYLDWLITNNISIPCKPFIDNNGNTHISEDFPIPQYFKYKLTHNSNGRKVNGKYIYDKNELGYQLSEHNLNKQIDNFILRLNTFYNDYNQISTNLPHRVIGYPSHIVTDTQRFNYLIDLDVIKDYFKTQFPRDLARIQPSKLALFRFCYKELINQSIPFDSSYDVALYNIRPHCDIDEFSIFAHPSQKHHETFKEGYEMYYYILDKINALDTYIKDYKEYKSILKRQEKEYNKHITTEFEIYQSCSETPTTQVVNV